MEDIDPEIVEEYRAERAKTALDTDVLAWNDVQLLRALGCVKKMEDGLYRPTVAGILLFGTRIALRRLFPLLRIDYMYVPSKEWVADPDSRFATVEIREPLIRAVRRVTSLILGDLPEQFNLPSGQLQREANRVVPDRVLREAIVNALMHRSYRQQRTIQIIRYTNRLEIRNPGYSLKNEEHLDEPGSHTRNAKIAAVMHEIRFAETKGSGIRVMRDLMQQAGLTPPLFESDRGRDGFVATFSFHHFLSEGDWNWLSAYKEFGLDDEEARALVWVRENGAIDNAVYRNLNGVDTLKASVHLRRLRDHGILEQKGRSAATFYLPGPNFTNAGELNVNAGEKSISAGEIPVSTGEKFSRDELLSLLAPDMREQVENLKERMGEAGWKSLICKICSDRFWSAAELSTLLNRGLGYLVRKYLTPMVNQKSLCYLYPDNPSHRHQAYKTNSRSEAKT